MRNATKLFLLIVLGWTIQSVFASQPAYAGPRGNKDRALGSAVQVITETTFGTTRRTTGFLFTSSGFVVTTFHGVSDAQRITVFHADHGVFEVDNIRKADKRTNVVVLSLANSQNLSVSCAPFGNSVGVLPGDKIHVVHHPALDDSALSHGEVIHAGYPAQMRQTAFTKSFASEYTLLEIDGSYDSGSAGGLVCNSGYEVVGLILAGNGETQGDGSSGAFAVTSHYLDQLLSANSKLGLQSLSTGSKSDVEFFDTFLGKAPQLRHYKDMMTEGFLLWFAPTHHFTFEDSVFAHEVNDKVDKTWFHTANLVVDKRPLREWSASRVFIWDAAKNPWGLGDAADRFVHFDADSRFSKLIYKNRETEEKIMTRHLLIMPLDSGMHKIQYDNRGANYKTTGTKRSSFQVSSGSLEMIDIEGLSLVFMRLLPAPTTKVGEADPVKYELERHMIQEKEINNAIRNCRYIIE